jgi:hypothetical protein
MGLKRSAIGKTFGECIGNLMGTCWEQKKTPPSPPPNLKNKNKIKAL